MRASHTLSAPQADLERQGSPRVLLLSAGVGAGHIKAADAVGQAIRTICPDAHVQHEDVLNLANRVYRSLIGAGYFKVAAWAPHFLGHLYDSLDGPGGNGGRLGDRVRLAIDRMNLRALTKLLCQGRWDLAIHTHFLSAMIMGRLRERGRIHTPFVTVTTDYDVHRLWIAPHCDLYCTATEETRSIIASRPISVTRIHVTGIPVHPRFGRRIDPLRARRELGLDEHEPVILQMAGGVGVGPLERIHQGILDLGAPVQVVVCAGRNEDARRRLEAIVCPPRHRRRVLGFTDQVQLLMSAADLVVTKPGGLTVTEAMACGAPLVLIDPIPGQESRNADFVLERGCGIKVNNLSAFTDKVSRLLSDPQWLSELRHNAIRAARPRAAFDVARRSLALLGKGVVAPQGDGATTVRLQTLEA
jgi:processive 1,2-diacylglycerol beta-glucosyltransferase